MLSRVAERVYWSARYLERVENTARLVSVYTDLLLDLPSEAGLGWEQLIAIAGAEEEFERLGFGGGERTTVRFLLTTPDNPGSLLSSLHAARENFRITRDIVPTEGWRCVNELHLFASEHLKRAVDNRHRHQVLSAVVSRCQRITGLLAGTMSHGDAYQFARMGRNLERADMSTRIIDVAAATLLTGAQAIAQAENTLWMNVLRSLSAYQMYRQYVRRRINPADVLEFLLVDRDFPRTVLRCLNELAASIRTLPNHDRALRRAMRVAKTVTGAPVGKLVGPPLHAFIDDLQLELARVHEQISATWFAPR